MKKIIITLMILCITGSFVNIVFAADKQMIVTSPDTTVNDEMVGILVENLENLIPIISQRQIFLNPAEALYSDVGKDTMVRMETYLGKRNIMLFANSDSIHDYSAYDKINDAYPTDFQLTMDVTVQDVFPGNEGGCFIGFTNYGVSAFSGNDGAVAVQLLVDGSSAEIYVRSQDADAGEHLSLGELKRKTTKLSIIHLTEHTFVFLNGNYAGQYHDGKSGPFQIIYGATVFTEGDTASCTFDNMVIRKAYN